MDLHGRMANYPDRHAASLVGTTARTLTIVVPRHGDEATRRSTFGCGFLWWAADMAFDLFRINGMQSIHGSRGWIARSGMLQYSSFCTADKEKCGTEPKQPCSAWHAMRPPADSIAADGADQHGSKKDRGTCVRTRFASYTLGKHRSQVRAPGPATTHNHSRHKRLAPRTSAAADKASQRPTSLKAIFKSTTRKTCFLGEDHEKNSRALRRARYQQNPKRIIEPASTNRPSRPLLGAGRGGGRRGRRTPPSSLPRSPWPGARAKEAGREEEAPPTTSPRQRQRRLLPPAATAAAVTVKGRRRQRESCPGVKALTTSTATTHTAAAPPPAKRITPLDRTMIQRT